MTTRRSIVAVLFALFVCVSAFAADAPAKSADLAGKVLDQSNQAIANAEVVLYYLDGARTDASKVVATAKAGADGAFAFPASMNWPDAAKGRMSRYFVIARDTDHGTGFTVVTAEDRTADVAVRLAGKQTSKVTVTGPDSKPMPEATVYLYACSPKGPSTDYIHASFSVLGDIGMFSAKTDAAGQAEIVVPSNCTYGFAARKAGYAKAYGGTDKIVLSAAGNVSGTVTYSDGKPAAGVRVGYTYYTPERRNDESTRTDDKGHFDLKDVAAPGSGDAGDDPFSGGAGNLTAEDSANNDVPSSISASISVKAGETLTKDLVLQKNLEFSGMVVDASNDKPLPGMNVYVNAYGQVGMSANRMLATDDQGRFRTGVPRGANVQLNFQPSANGKYLLDDQQMMNSNQNFQNLTADKKDMVLRAKLIPIRTLMGKVVDAAGNGVGGAKVFGDPRVPPVASAADGTFTLTAAPADRAFSLLAMGGDAGGVVAVKRDDQQATIKLQPLVDREVIAATATDKPAADLTFSASPSYNGTSWYQAQAAGGPTDAAGKTRLKGLVPGLTYNINWNGQGKGNLYGYGNTTIDLAAAKGDEPLRITVKQYSNTLTGKVVNSKDEPIANARFELRSQQMVNQQNMGRYYNTKTAADGSFKFEQLADGNIDLMAYSGNYRRLLVSLPTNKTDAKIVLHTQQEPARHEVIVIDEKGNPMPDVPLLVAYRERQAPQAMQETVNTDANGIADLTDLPADDMTAVCDRDEYNIAAVSMQSYEEGQYRMVLSKALPPRQVRIVDDTGKPIVGMDVRVTSFSAISGNDGYNNTMAQLYNWPQDLLNATGMIQKTDAQGRAVFPRVSHKQYIGIQLQSKTYGDQHKDLQVSQTDAEAEIRVSVPGSVSGKVTLKGNPAADFSKLQISLRPNQSGNWQQGQVRPDGSYSITNVVPGSYTAGVITFNRNPVLRKYKLRGDHSISVEPAKAIALDLELQEGIAIRGKLEYNADPNATGKPRIAVQEPNSSYLMDVDVDPAGNFEAYVSGPGTFTPMYLLPGSNQWENAAPITVPDDKPLEGVIVKAKPARN